MHITPRWILPMSGGRDLLEQHTLVVRDGRILEIVPADKAQERYTPRVSLERPSHLLMPGLVNAHTRIGSPPGEGTASVFSQDLATIGIANMLKTGVTAFCDVGYFPDEAARTAVAQGLRAVIGLPVAAQPSAWARAPAEYLTRALKLRDEYKGHPAISTAFAPLHVHTLEDSTLARISTLAAELDAAVVIALNRSRRDIEECVARHGMRPLARLESLGLLTPALIAVHAVSLEERELELIGRAGAGIALCLAADLVRGGGLPPIEALAAARASASGAAANPSAPRKICGTTSSSSRCTAASPASIRYFARTRCSRRRLAAVPRCLGSTPRSARSRRASGRICAVSISADPPCNPRSSRFPRCCSPAAAIS
jgi:5-methylthioadenosine/S-adenosylhomocysteine deaminase